MLVELKNGETLNGHLINCDTWMNLTLKEVVQTNPEGTAFFRLPEVYVRGNNVNSAFQDCVEHLANDGDRSSIFVFRMRSLIWSKISNKTNHRAEAGVAVFSEAGATEAEAAPEVLEDVVEAEAEEVEYRQI